jgi:hypothetical protein
MKAPHPCPLPASEERGNKGSAAAGGLDLGVARKPAERLFRKGKPAIDRDLENAAAALDQFDLGAVSLDQDVPRTEGARFVVSGHAVFDPDLHGSASRRLSIKF